jgi:signal transduction histidine kinase
MSIVQRTHEQPLPVYPFVLFFETVYNKSVMRFVTKNTLGQCRELGVRWWQCPQIVFGVIGASIAGALVLTNALANQYVDPAIAFGVVSVLSIFALIYLFIVVRAFELLLESRSREREKTKEILQLKDQFVFIAAHELRAPANAIKWALEEFERHIQVHENQEMLTILSKSSDRLLELVSDLLSVARMENKTITVNLADTNLEEVLKGSIATVTQVAHEQNISIETQGISPLMRVFVDKSRLKEVFENILTNAIKYSNQGDMVLVEVIEKETEIAIAIKDTGMGISEEDKSHLFEKFWRSKEARKSDGTGLGLFIVRELVHLMHAEISFTSVFGEGSTFTVTLPKVSQENDTKQNLTESIL